MKAALCAVGVLMAVLSGSGAPAPPVAPFERFGGWTAPSPIDDCVAAVLKERGIERANPCSDEVFIRRVYVDAIGTLPEPAAVWRFLSDNRPDRRAALIDSLLEREEFADYWAMKWCDVLRVKSEFPINLWPNAVQAYHRWVHDAIRTNMPYDQFARELLTSSGSSFRVPPVNFYRAIQGRQPADIAHAVALTFMGTRLETWPKADQANIAAFFSRIAYKKTDEWKEEIVLLDPAPAEPLDAVLPDGTAVRIQPDQDPRHVFADRLVAKGSPWFGRSVVNRVWAWLMGRGIIHEPDDIRPDNPAANPELLAYLERELVDAGYDLRQLYRLILNSRTYQQSSIPQSEDPEAEPLFAYYPTRRLEAEVLTDALCWIGGDSVSYTSPIPEPFTYTPDFVRSISLADGSITSAFLDMFGRPARDTGLMSERNDAPTDAQRRYLLNSTDVQRRIEGSQRLRNVAFTARANRRSLVSGLYVTILSRPPTPAEAATAESYLQTGRLNPRQAVSDLAWALINTKEFLYRH